MFPYCWKHCHSMYMMSMFIYFWNRIIFIWFVVAAVDAAAGGGDGCGGGGGSGDATANTALFSNIFNTGSTSPHTIQFNSVPFAAYVQHICESTPYFKG